MVNNEDVPFDVCSLWQSYFLILFLCCDNEHLTVNVQAFSSLTFFI